MGIEKISFKVKSSDKIHDLAGYVYIPENNAKGFFHIVHGMTEHITRYDRIMTDLADEGYICFGYDNLGHGKTVNDKTELGFIAEKNGWDLLLRDVKLFSDAVINKFSDNTTERQPYYLMGHSMGSFIVRLAAEKYVKPDKLIIMGTGGPNPASSAGIAVVELTKLFHGSKYISPLVYKLAFGGYNTKFKSDPDANSQSWLSTDQSIRKKYMDDEYCTFKFTVSAMGDLMRLLKNSNRPDWYKNISKKMPILLLSGKDDPVGDYGKGVETVHAKLKANGANSRCIIYENARHEILNDFTYDQVKKDIIEFFNG